MLPLGAQFGRAQHGGDDLGAVGGRVGVVAADDALDLRQHAAGFFFAGANHAERPDALAVEREALGEGGGDEKVEPGGKELLDDRAVLGNAFAEALVGHVEEGHELARLEGGDHLFPLRRADVVAGGVVAAGVQHDDGARGGGVERGEHGVEVHALLGGVVIGISAHVEARGFEERAVVFPAGVGDQHLRVGVEALEEVGAHFQPAGAAQALHRGDAARGHGLVVGAEHQSLHRFVVGGDAVDGQIAARLGRLHELRFSRFHAGQQRQLAVGVGIDADAQVDLVGVGVSSKLFVQAEDGIARGHFHAGKKRLGHGRWEVR